jgi:hypothetical protein
MEIDKDKIDDAVLALLWLTHMTEIEPGKASTGIRLTGCTPRD